MSDELDYTKLADSMLDAQARREQAAAQASWASRHATLEQALPGVRQKYDLTLTADGPLAASFTHDGRAMELRQVRNGWILTDRHLPGRELMVTQPADLDRHLAHLAEERERSKPRRHETRAVNVQQAEAKRPYGFQGPADVEWRD